MAHTPAPVEDFRQGRIRLLNLEYEFGLEDFWEATEKADLSPLTRETLYYHRFLLEWLLADGCQESDRATVESLLDDWLDRHPPGYGADWNPFTVAYRTQVWLRICLLEDSRNLKDLLAPHLFRHGLHLERNLEFHLGGNHLLKDLAALLMLSAWFEGPTSDRWFERLIDLLGKEIRTQILPDGGHYERSPMYHLLVLGDLLDLRDLLATIRPEVVETLLGPAIERMVAFLAGVLHPDGDIPFFNDSVLGQAPPPSLAFERAGADPPLPNRLDSAPIAGFFRFQTGSLALLFDAGPLGPDALMGHVHNDALSFELSLGADRWIVNRGVPEYTPGPKRTECRSIASHNTPCLGGFEQSEVWSSFRVARRWHSDRLEISPIGAHPTVRASWVRPGMPRIARTVRIPSEGRIDILDEFEGKGLHPLVSPLHFAPGVQLADEGWVEMDSRRVWTWRAERGGGQLLLRFEIPSNLDLRVCETVWWPGFHREEKIQVLRLEGPIHGSERIVLSVTTPDRSPVPDP